jgi:argininosuccinate lyase
MKASIRIKLSLEEQMSGRLEKDPSAEFKKIVLGHELSELGNAALTPLVQVNAAHVKMLSKQRLIPEETMKKLLGALKTVSQGGVAALDTEHTEDLYFALEQKIVDLLGIKDAGNIHIGRSRNDIYSTIYRIILRRRLLDTEKSLLSLSRAVLDTARNQRDAAMPGYTHTQHAQPVTAGYYFLGFFEALSRDILRLRQAWGIINKSPLGAAAITTTRFNLDRYYTAGLLGFDGIVYNAYDAISGREYVNDAVITLNTIASDVSRVVADLMTWNMPELAFIEVPDEYAVISSIMPQKKNPAAFEFLRSAASWVLGDTVGVISSAKAVSYSDIRDATKYHYTPLWHALEVTENMLNLFAEILPLLKWNRARMLKDLREGYSTMTDLADYFVETHGITFREAHRIVAAFVRLSIADGKNSDQLSIQTLQKVCKEQGFSFVITPEDFEKTLDPKGCLARRNVAGGTSDEQMDIMFNKSEEIFSKEKAWYEKQKKLLEKAEKTMFDIPEK